MPGFLGPYLAFPGQSIRAENGLKTWVADDSAKNNLKNIRIGQKAY